MTTGGDTGQDFHLELQELLHSVRGMAEGNYHRLVNVRARGIVGELAVYINQTLKNLQSLDPTVKRSSREIPKVTQQLTEIIKTTEEAANRVLEEVEQLVEEQTRVEQGLSQVVEMLRHTAAAGRLAEMPRLLEEIQDAQRRSHGRTLDIMAAMEFQDLTTQKIQRLISLVAEVESRLLQLLVMFRLGDRAEGEATDLLLETVAQDETALCNQEIVDQLLREFQAAKA
jgi:chemotaxis regulatin CheY-phosphate phosphatase CheZ